MLKKTMTYTNLDGVEVTENFYFNLTKAELLKMQLSEDEGFKEHLEKIIASGNGGDIVGAFEQILRMAYGERTTDGKFQKSAEAFNHFMTTEAYSDLFFELVTDAKKSAEFISAIIPSAMAEEVQQAQGLSTNLAIVDEVPSDSENMSIDELRAALGVNNDETEKEEPRLTHGLTDAEILRMPSGLMSTQPREVLLRAFQLKSAK